MITKIWDKQTREEVSNWDVRCSHGTYKHIYVNDVMINKKNQLMVEYVCPCGKNNIVSLNIMVKKINKENIQCPSCVQNVFDPKTIAQFDNEDTDFKKQYFRHVLTLEEYNHIKHNIKAIQSNKFSNLDEFDYLPCVPTHTSNRYGYYLYHKTRDALEPFINITLQCQDCSNLFVSKDITSQKNKFKVLCDDCCPTNSLRKIKTHKNSEQESIKYHLTIQRRLIEKCNVNNILIQDGPKISDEFKIDYQIPQQGILIQCRDTQRMPVGLQESVDNYINSQDSFRKFVFVHPKNYMKIFKMLAANKI